MSEVGNALRKFIVEEFMFEEDTNLDLDSTIHFWSWEFLTRRGSYRC